MHAGHGTGGVAGAAHGAWAGRAAHGGAARDPGDLPKAAQVRTQPACSALVLARYPV